ncbi:MAG TPA: type II secretion system protein [Actinomycetota bacterium]|nr:type II secretion system protein [Actinomycetota bacterium]
MTALFRRRRRERGFTIVETLAALTVFSIITIGIVPLLGNSMRSLGVSRNRTIAENVVRAAVERLEGIRYYVSWDAKAKKVDLLDYYLPQTAGAFAPGQSYSTAAANPPLASPATGGTGVFTTVCPPPSGTNQACPSDIPAGYTLTFTASFVQPVTTTTPQTYRVVNPISSYSASPAVAGTCQTAPCSDKPPADLIDVKVTGSWSYGGKARSFAVRSLIGERTFFSGPVSDAAPPPPGSTPEPTSAPNPAAPVRMRASAAIDYVVQANTGYSLTSGSNPQPCGTEPCNHSEMTYTLGTSDARIETKDVSSADVATRYAEARIVRTYPPGTTPPANPPPDLTYVTGATSVLHAPPFDYRVIDDQRTTITDVPNPDQPFALQGRIYQNENHDMKVDVSNELPQAEGSFRSASGANLSVEWYAHNTQRDPTTTGPMHWDTAQPILTGYRYSAAGPNTVRGFTKANTGALGTPDRRVESTSSVRMPWLYFFPRVYAGRNGGDSFNPMWIYDFQADVQCKSTANAATAVASGSWSVAIGYYYDPTNNGKTNDHVSGYITLSSSGMDTLDGTPVPDALEALKAQNPLVYDASSTSACCAGTSDVYMFDVRTGPSTSWRRGYIENWSSNKNVETSESSDGRTTSAAINGALRIETASLRQTLTPDIPQTGFNVSFGKLACNAVDNR